MREKERDPRERSGETQWTTIKRKKHRNQHHQASKTCFINHLPSSITIPEISQIFRTHGAIANIYIPTSQKNPNHIFAFVQYQYPQSLLTAIRDENGKIVKGSKIIVFPAKYDKPITYPAQNLQFRTKKTQHPDKTTTTKPNINKPRFRDYRSYREVTKASFPHSNPETNNPKKTQDLKKTPEVCLIKPNPSRHRIMSSRCLGEHTEQVRESLKEIDAEDDFAAAIDGERCEENEETLLRSAIGVTDSIHASETIMDHILAEGVNCLSIKTMGGMQHLITFNSLEDKKAMIESKWLERWFIAIRDVNKHSAALWRETWLNVYGTPLIAWGYKNFHKIGSIFGRVKTVLYNNFDCAHILVTTDCLFDINCKIQMQVDEVKYSIFISEKQQVNIQKSSPCEEEMDSDTEEIPVKEVTPSPGKSSFSEKTCPMNEKTKSPDKKGDYVSNHDVEENSKSPSQIRQKTAPQYDKPTDEPLNLDSLNLVPHVNNSQPRIPNHCTPIKGAKSDQSYDIISPIGFHRSPTTKIHQIQNESPTNKQTNRSPMNVSPKKPPIPSNNLFSPIQINNKFDPLSRPNKTKSSSISTLGSSSCSGPLFPPGFEDSIPTQTKIEKEKKRRRKMEKRNKMRNQMSENQIIATKSPPKKSNSIHIDDVISMAESIGLTFNGTTGELRKRIGSVLTAQRLNWEANLA